MYSLVLLSLVASVSASAYHNTLTPNIFYDAQSVKNFFNAQSGNVYYNGLCPVVKPMENFNFEAYGSGIWLEMAKYPNGPEQGGQCGSTEYTLQGDTILTKSYHVNNGRLASIEGSARLAHPCTSQGKMIFTLPYGAGGAKQDYIGYILDTDYENYSIVYYCKYNAEKRSRQDFAWILTRSKSLDAITKSKIDKVIRESKFLDGSKFIYTDFSEPSCRFYY